MAPKFLIGYHLLGCGFESHLSLIHRYALRRSQNCVGDVSGIWLVVSVLVTIVISWTTILGQSWPLFKLFCLFKQNILVAGRIRTLVIGVEGEGLITRIPPPRPPNSSIVILLCWIPRYDNYRDIKHTCVHGCEQKWHSGGAKSFSKLWGGYFWFHW